ncbi:TPA: hypothetical protein ACQUNC_005445 [Bacillus paranthracis]|jgi:hypothetical protein|uniref:hypothetical protein n=1 Tax=Bacillus cereus group TaxID=86661 RepID=UPI0029C3E715|nr:hypothetical protein [Bacillus cereus group sp. BfR-BA-00431]MDX5947653.1 hypothetical protein [Bacillus cereus group sp. BfR-BA-00431]
MDLENVVTIIGGICVIAIIIFMTVGVCLYIYIQIREMLYEYQVDKKYRKENMES